MTKVDRVIEPLKKLMYLIYFTIVDTYNYSHENDDKFKPQDPNYFKY